MEYRVILAILVVSMVILGACTAWLFTEVNSLRAGYEELKEQYVKLEGAYEDLLGKYEELLNKYEDVSKKYDSLRDKYLEVVEEISGVREFTLNLADELKAFALRLEELENVSQAIESQYEEVAKEADYIVEALLNLSDFLVEIEEMLGLISYRSTWGPSVAYYMFIDSEPVERFYKGISFSGNVITDIKALTLHLKSRVRYDYDKYKRGYSPVKVLDVALSWDEATYPADGGFRVIPVPKGRAVVDTWSREKYAWIYLPIYLVKYRRGVCADYAEMFNLLAIKYGVEHSKKVIPVYVSVSLECPWFKGVRSHALNFGVAEDYYFAADPTWGYVVWEISPESLAGSWVSYLKSRYKCKVHKVYGFHTRKLYSVVGGIPGELALKVYGVRVEKLEVERAGPLSVRSEVWPPYTVKYYLVDEFGYEEGDPKVTLIGILKTLPEVYDVVYEGLPG